MYNYYSIKFERKQLIPENYVTGGTARSQLDELAGLPTQRRVLFVKTIQQLESSSDLVNKQLEQIFVNDLQNSREKLGVLAKKMKDSEQELGALIARIDKISGYLLAASNLIQSSHL
jgi:hypothetical protein